MKIFEFNNRLWILIMGDENNNVYFMKSEIKEELTPLKYKLESNNEKVNTVENKEANYYTAN